MSHNSHREESWQDRPLFEVPEIIGQGLPWVELMSHGTRLGEGLGAIGPALTFAEHDPVSHGPMSWVERAAVTGTEMLANRALGPLAPLDAVTGGNFGGAARSATGAAFTIAEMLGGNLDAGQQYTDAVLDGKYGHVAQAAGYAGDALGGGIYDIVNDNSYAGDVGEGRAKIAREAAAGRAWREKQRAAKEAAAGQCFAHLAD